MTFSLLYPGTVMSADKQIEANIAGIAQAVNTKNLANYGQLVTEDFLNMNRDLDGEVTSTVGRQSRLDLLEKFFEHSPFEIRATMKASGIHVDGQKAFAQVDGVLEFRPKNEGSLDAFKLYLDLFLFYTLDEQLGWLSERSMGIETRRGPITEV